MQSGPEAQRKHFMSSKLPTKRKRTLPVRDMAWHRRIYLQTQVYASSALCLSYSKIAKAAGPAWHAAASRRAAGGAPLPAPLPLLAASLVIHGGFSAGLKVDGGG